MVDVKGILGKSEGLPCDIKPKDRDDAVAMVLWFKETVNGPIYRWVDILKAPHWVLAMTCF